MKRHHLALGALFLPACGGTESAAADATTDVADAMPEAACDDADCERSEVSYDVACPDCPTGWVCVHKPAVAQNSVYCVRIPDCCHGVPTCECMGACACAPLTYRGCLSATATEIQSDGPISLRIAKTDVRYVSDDERAVLAAQALSTPLATYRYRAGNPAISRLGFLIDDQPPTSFAVAADRAHVDLYGYASMLLATIQQQQATIDELRERVARLEAATVTPPRSRDRRSRSPRPRASTNRSSPR